MSANKFQLVKPLFTSSWDDGHPLDSRLGELLQLHGFRATFFVPLTNREGLPVMSAQQIRSLRQGGFEIGSHTLDHWYLTVGDDATARYQISEGKDQLEQILGETVHGFCYPGGKFAKRHVEMVRTAGFAYARTVENLRMDIPKDTLSMPVGLQLYPHSSAVMLRNFIRGGSWWRRHKMFAQAISEKDLLKRLVATLDMVCAEGGVFHLWGHSWEFEKFAGWALLHEFLSYAADRIQPEERLSNIDVLRIKAVLT
jgi:peptidoglycan/xylan/chitin deacetylase (PgdA/CDA1 family)